MTMTFPDALFLIACVLANAAVIIALIIAFTRR